MPRFLVAFLGLLATLAMPAQAAPERYQLDTERSRVNFTYVLNGNEITGRMPVRSAELLIDLDALSNSRITVTLDASAARAGIFFATEAMHGPSVLDTRRHPLIRFHSTLIRGSLRGAVVTGRLTVRNVTQPVRLRAGLYRQQGTAPTDRDKLIVLLTGEISRSAFGATGYPDLVGDPIGLRILAWIRK